MLASDPTLALTKALIAQPSVTPMDGNCQHIIARRLAKIGFQIEHLAIEDVHNLWATRGHQPHPLFVFAGHTDVVPTGPRQEWQSHPFTPTVKGDYLYGRGAADMKGSLAAMVVATERFISEFPDYQGAIGFLITSDEEGPAQHGTRAVMAELAKRDIQIDYCIVGEPTSDQRIADTIKNGRRGSLHLKIKIKGVQGHVAYPHQANNAIHLALAALTPLTTHIWDQGDQYFPPTTFQIVNIQSGTGAMNVIPGELQVACNFRFGAGLSQASIMQTTEAILAKTGVDFELSWQLSGPPFITEAGQFIAAVSDSIEKHQQIRPALSTSGGTSDGRFIAPTGTELVELGPVNATIHKVNECVKISDLIDLTSIYYEVLKRVLIDS